MSFLKAAIVLVLFSFSAMSEPLPGKIIKKHVNEQQGGDGKDKTISLQLSVSTMVQDDDRGKQVRVGTDTPEGRVEIAKLRAQNPCIRRFLDEIASASDDDKTLQEALRDFALNHPNKPQPVINIQLKRSNNVTAATCPAIEIQIWMTSGMTEPSGTKTRNVRKSDVMSLVLDPMAPASARKEWRVDRSLIGSVLLSRLMDLEVEMVNVANAEKAAMKKQDAQRAAENDAQTDPFFKRVK